MSEPPTICVVDDYPDPARETTDGLAITQAVSQILASTTRSDLHALLRIEPIFDDRERKL